MDIATWHGFHNTWGKWMPSSSKICEIGSLNLLSQAKEAFAQKTRNGASIS
jgi:hypothetical protein